MICSGYDLEKYVSKDCLRKNMAVHHLFSEKTDHKDAACTQAE